MERKEAIVVAHGCLASHPGVHRAAAVQAERVRASWALYIGLSGVSVDHREAQWASFNIVPSLVL